MPTTAERRWCVPLAIRWFQLQRYPDCRLLIVFDGPGTVRDLLPVGDSRIECIELSGDRSLGQKFNACVRLAETDWIALWADDDWHAADRLDVLMGHRDAGDVIGASWALFRELVAPGDTWIYRAPDPLQGNLVGGTLVFKRAVWERTPFPDRPSGVDTVWQWDAHKAGAAFFEVGESPAYVAMVHGQTTGRKTWPPPSKSSVFKRWSGDLRAIMGDDLGAYLRAYSRRPTADLPTAPRPE
jgi:hypothetical protein